MELQLMLRPAAVPQAAVLQVAVLRLVAQHLAAHRWRRQLELLYPLIKTARRRRPPRP
jgi:hypothetical protein